MSVELPFEVQMESLYTDLFKYGLTDHFDSDADFDAIHSWASVQVFDFRRRMREDVEKVLPDGMTIEEFLVLSKYLLTVASEGETEFSRPMVFKSYRHRDTSPFKEGHAFEDEITQSMEEAFTNLTIHKSDLEDLIQGFFLLKKNFVDGERLTRALRSVEENFDEYLREMAKVGASDLADAYRVGTSRSNATKEFSTILEAVSDFTTELRKLHQQVRFDQVHEEIERYKSVYSTTHTAEDLLEIYDTLDDATTVFNVRRETEWGNAETLMRESPRSLKLSEFGAALDTFSDVSPDGVVELLKLMHEYEATHDDQKAWDIYDILLEMVSELDSVAGADDVDFRERLRESDEFKQFVDTRESIETNLGRF